MLRALALSSGLSKPRSSPATVVFFPLFFLVCAILTHSPGHEDLDFGYPGAGDLDPDDGVEGAFPL